MKSVRTKHKGGARLILGNSPKAAMTVNRKLIKYWLPVFLWMVFIFWMSTGTFSSQNTSFLIEPVLRFLSPEILPQQIDLINTLIRKAGHVIEYFILSILLLRAFRGDSKESWNWRWASLSIILVVLYAAGDEFHQSFVPVRTASVVDVAIDTAGGILAQLIGVLWHYYKEQ